MLVERHNFISNLPRRPEKVIVDDRNQGTVFPYPVHLAPKALTSNANLDQEARVNLRPPSVLVAHLACVLPQSLDGARCWAGHAFIHLKIARRRIMPAAYRPRTTHQP